MRVPPERLGRWVENFERRHGHTTVAVDDAGLTGTAEDGSTFAARLPFGKRYDGSPDAAAFAVAASAPDDWGILLVRKGGFAVARMAGDRLRDSKVGQRHVQGRTKAGGQSQQRFARRRENQARDAYQATARHAARILAGLSGPLVTGGDHAGVAVVLEDARLTGLAVVDDLPDVPDPRRAVLEQAVADASAVHVRVVNA